MRWAADATTTEPPRLGSTPGFDASSVEKNTERPVNSVPTNRFGTTRASPRRGQRARIGMSDQPLTAESRRHQEWLGKDA
jgi:hypothetical protein